METIIAILFAAAWVLVALSFWGCLLWAGKESERRSHELHRRLHGVRPRRDGMWGDA
jgi:hypothetical protein